MPETIGPVIIRFGGGRRTNAVPMDIQDVECQAGENFSLNPGSNLLSSRKPVELAGTAPNGAEVRGYAQLEKIDGTISTLIQAGSILYEWDGTATGFTVVATVSATAKLRGRNPEHNFTLDDEVIITDLNKVEEVATWNGTVYATMATGLPTGTTFFAKYCHVENERAFFANVKSGTDTPHLIVGSERSDKNILSLSQRPAVGVTLTDPFFIPIPDLTPINGMAAGFGVVAFSTRRKTYKLTGEDATDFAIKSLHEDSGVSGDEALINIGNDILIPRIGKIDTLSGTDRFGDVLADDLSQEIMDDIENEKNWQAAFDPVTSRVYLIPDTANKVHVLNKGTRDRAALAKASGAQGASPSPWSKYVTDLSFAFSSSCLWRMKDPIDGKFKVYIGGTTGEVYQFDGDGGQDGGANNISVSRTSKVFSMPPNTVFEVEGTIRYRRPTVAQQVTIEILHEGTKIVSDTRTISLAANTAGAFFGGDFWWGGDWYWGAPSNRRAARKQFKTAAQSSEYAVRVSAAVNETIGIEEIAIVFKAKKERP